MRYSINRNNYGRWYVQERVSPTLYRIVKSDLTQAQARKLADTLNAQVAA
jgi:hypothetical protein